MTTPFGPNTLRGKVLTYLLANRDLLRQSPQELVATMALATPPVACQTTTIKDAKRAAKQAIQAELDAATESEVPSPPVSTDAAVPMG
ncbi:hypothetical protein OAO01_01460 [Oligoflexia bacterium]|nr:hypothetical protein [Oligoflexia bacterium]